MAYGDEIKMFLDTEKKKKEREFVASRHALKNAKGSSTA